jgi:hypothetical protein
MGMNMKIVPSYQRQEEQSDKNESDFVSIYLDILLKVSNVFIFSVVVYIAQETWNYFLYIYVFINKLVFELDKFVQGNRYGKFLVL